eukprot:Tbor_TRINITY_DN4818_c0_g2::TRINITY_DN4818_c0_g2_i1::g.1218::m.1218
MKGASQPVKTFWGNNFIPLTIQQVKGSHAADRNSDRNTRSTVRNEAVHVGTVSNLYPIHIDQSVKVHRYDIKVMKRGCSDTKEDNPFTISTSPSSPNRHVANPSRAWRLFTRAFKDQSQDLPIVRVMNRIYTTKELPSHFLKLPKEYYDVGWTNCFLKPHEDGPVSIKDLLDDEKQILVNKLIPWSVSNEKLGVSPSSHTPQQTFSSVREIDGKIACIGQGFSVGGVRVYHGATAHALFTTGASSAVSGKPSFDITSSRDLENYLGDNKKPGPITQPIIKLTVMMHETSLTVSDRIMTVYMVGDSSAYMRLRVWDQPHLVSQLQQGHTYEVSNLATVMAYDQQSMELQGTIATTFKDIAPPSSSTVLAQKEAASLTVRLDTKCTIASEMSLWDEVQHHFGPPPYNNDVQRQINASVERMPVVTSHSLKHGIVRILNFRIKNLGDVPLDPQLRSKFGNDIDIGQPFAIMKDFSIWPLQALHCCFDPTMRAWQDIAVSSCSFFPQKRFQLLSSVQQTISRGLHQWGITIDSDPLITKDLSILSPVTKSRGTSFYPQQKYGNYQQYQQPHNLGPDGPAPLFPSTPSHKIVCGVFNARASSKDKEMIANTANGLSDRLKTPFVIHSPTEVAAIEALEQTLTTLQAQLGPGQMIHPAIIFVTLDRDSRAARWLKAEALKKGVVPLLVPPCKPAKIPLLGGNLITNLSAKFSSDPLKGVSLAESCPFTTGKRILAVGIDTCHLDSVTTGAAVGILMTPRGNASIPMFWRNDVRGQELEQVTSNFQSVIQSALTLCEGLDEVVVFQDGNVFSELESMKRCIPVGTNLTFTCLHKRTDIRFAHQGPHIIANNVRGTVIESLTPSPRNVTHASHSFFLQAHDSAMSTARGVQYTVHCTSPTLSMTQVQQLSFALSHAHTHIPTKLPLPTRCAHRLSAATERLIDACPDFSPEMIHDPVAKRMWFL